MEMNYAGGRKETAQHSQLQQGPVRITVGVLVLALLLQVVLEEGDSLGVVSLQTRDDGRDLRGSLLGVFAVHIGQSEGVVVKIGGRAGSNCCYGGAATKL